MLRMFLLFSLLLACLAHPAQAFEAPEFQTDVLDEVGLLDADTRNDLTVRIAALREQNDIWAAVYVAGSLQGDSIENAALVTFEKWKLGQAGKDNGLLVLIVPSERQMRIEVGYGLEGFITDAFSKRIIDEIYAPAFREEHFGDGLMRGFEAMAAMARQDGSLAQLLPAPPPEPELDWQAALSRFFLALLVNLLPAGLFRLAQVRGRKAGRLGEQEGREDFRTLFLMLGFIGLIFGLFFAVFGLFMDSDPEVLPALAGMNSIFLILFSLPFAGKVRGYLSDKVHRRQRAMERLLRLRRRTGKTRPIFGVMFDPAQVGTSQGGSRPEPRSSGSSSSSSSSSSSGGGRSGGGGASGGW